jgi:ubiquinone/menaquinone biosynthesis C-methylase UbiE
VLEIGFGTGLNLQHYTDRVERLDILDPAQGMHTRARERIAASPLQIRTHTLGAEQLPFDDGSFDAVVCTFTLCTIPDPVAAAAEVRRVLAPGAAFHVLEHVGSINPGVRRWQRRLNPVQRVLGCGCQLDRDLDRILEAAGFEAPELERIVQPKTPRIFREHVRGRARK